MLQSPANQHAQPTTQFVYLVNDFILGFEFIYTYMYLLIFTEEL